MDYIDNHILTEKQKKNLEELVGKIKSVMSFDLYSHSIGTLKYAQKLAGIYLPEIEHAKSEKKDGGNISENKSEIYYRLYISCILHDYGKIFSYNELVKVAKENKLDISEFELNCQSLIHSFVGDYLVKRDFGISDEKILKAIKFHTIGYCNMTLSDKILFVSDKIEENRDYESINNFRDLSIKNIDLCLLGIYRGTIIYVMKRSKLLHPDTSKIWNSICGGE